MAGEVTRVVLDASIVGRALIPTQVLPQAAALLSRWPVFHSPSILRQEFCNCIHRANRRGLLALNEADLTLARFELLTFYESFGAPWIGRALAIARRYRQPRIFDALYFVCAEDLGADLWTCDRKFVASFGPDRPGWLKLCPDDVGTWGAN